jgi:DNA-binding NarL/FixJ family response regulator
MEAEAAELSRAESAAVPARKKTLRLFICDPHHLFRECLAAALDRHDRFTVVAWAGSAGAVLEKLAQNPPDVLVLGVDVLDQEFLGLIQDVRTLAAGMKILVLGRPERDEHVVDCLLAGAGGFLLRDQSLVEVAAAIEVVARGEKVCPPRATRLLFTRLGELGRARKRRNRLEVLKLSARETEILRLVADGMTNQEIAGRLYLSVHTVKNHVHRILEVLGVRSRWEAVSHAFGKGWLQEQRQGDRASGD